MARLRRRWRLLGLLLVMLALAGAIVHWLHDAPPEQLPAGVLDGHIVFRAVYSSEGRKEHGWPNNHIPVALDLRSLIIQTLPLRSWLVAPGGEWLIDGRPGEESAKVLIENVDGSTKERQLGVVASSQGPPAPFYSGMCGPPWHIGWIVHGKWQPEGQYPPHLVVLDVRDSSMRTSGPAVPAGAEWCIGREAEEVFASRDGKIRRYRLRGAPQELASGSAPAWSAEGGLAYLTPDLKRIKLLDPESGASRALNGPGRRMRALAWSPDGRFIAFTYAFPGMGSRFGEFRIGVVDVQSGSMWHVMPADTISPDIRGVFNWKGLQWSETFPSVADSSNHP